MTWTGEWLNRHFLAPHRAVTRQCTSLARSCCLRTRQSIAQDSQMGKSRSGDRAATITKPGVYLDLFLILTILSASTGGQ